MIIKRSPQRRDETLEVTVTGDLLNLNGVSFDFGDLAEGQRLPGQAVDSEWLPDQSTVARDSGQITLEVLWPHGPNAPEEDRFPAPYTPPIGKTGEAGVIDWSQVYTEQDKETQRLIQWREEAFKPRAVFAERAAEVGLITWKEAAAWTAGNALPQIAQDYIVSLPAAEQDKATFVLLARENVRRMAPEIQAIEKEVELPPEQVDALFA